MESPKTSFTDAKGRLWDLELNLVRAKRIDNSDYSLLLEGNQLETILVPSKELITKLFTNVGLQFALIWTICSDQIKDNLSIDIEDVQPEGDKTAKEVREELLSKAEDEFLAAIDGRVREEAKESFFTAIKAFFPAQEKGLSLWMEQLKTAERKIQENLSQIGELMEEEIEKAVNKSFQKLKTDIESIGGKSTE